ncbi:cyclase family protein [Oceanithermus sp.]|uniref:cyclase family protein n=1 Tax=Oceanithermus sp. TaxID=2268145 RepID=UPI0025802F48|nr:cyclase family protein [Oceanithermus sp.]
MPRFIDLSATIANSPEGTPEFFKTEIAYADHEAGARQIQALFGVPPELLREGEGWAVETITRLGTHDATHVDAPYHYNRRIGGEPAATVDRLPLEWFFADGVVLDMTGRERGQVVEVADLEAELGRIGYTLKPLDIVLVRTGMDAYYAQPDYFLMGPGVSPEATRWLFDRGVRVMGIDAWSWDAPLDLQAEAALREKRPGVFWAAHQADLPYAQIERLVGLDRLPPFGFKVAAFPLKIEGASAGPARVVAILD